MKIHKKGTALAAAAVFALASAAPAMADHDTVGGIPEALAAGERLTPIPGAPPSLLALPAGCSFRPRCAYATEVCRQSPAELISLDDSHQSRCHNIDALPPLHEEVSA